MKKEWKIFAPISPEVACDLGEYNPILKQLLYNRGIQDSNQANSYLNMSGSLHDPKSILGMNEAVERIWKAIDSGEDIAVYGDYDVDGVSSTALLVQAIEKLGGKVSGYIPNRFDEGYGLNTEALDDLKNKEVKLVITVDCGIRSLVEARYAREIGLDLIISDHHEPKGGNIPQAIAVICPKQKDDLYPEKNLAGVGLAYKIVQALQNDRQESGLDADRWLDLVAVGTVADMVPLTGENRALVKKGLMILKSGSNQWVSSMLATAGIAFNNITARDIGFVIGPRLNAAGRLESAMKAFNLLMVEDITKIGYLVQVLGDQNTERQRKTREMFEEAENNYKNTWQDHIITTASEKYEMGIVGLVASRLVDAHYRPVVVGSIDYEKGTIRASCRSIPEIHITKALDQCSDLFMRHGGHAMAAGFTIRTDKFPELEMRLREIVQQQLAGRELIPVYVADMEIDLKKISEESNNSINGIKDIMAAIDCLEPTGMDNRGVLFVSRNFTIKKKKAVGENKNHLSLSLYDGRSYHQAIAFRQGELISKLSDKVDVLYSLEKNMYNGEERLQLNVKDIRNSNE